MRVGLFGGTFDPLHAGHLAVAEEVRERMDLDSVRFLPCRQPPHKARPELTSGADRLAMIALGTQDRPHLVPFSFELTLPTPSYTIETLRALQAAEPDSRFYFIMGMDSFEEIETWKEYEDLIREYHLVVVNRPGCRDLAPGDDLPGPARGRLVDGLTDRDAADGRIHLLQVHPQAATASEVRRKASQGEKLGNLVPASVDDYIRKCALYT